METELIKNVLMNNFLNWYTHLYGTENKPKEQHLRQYLGYMGINRRHEVLFK